MTRKIPDDVMSRTPEERARVKKLNDAELLKAMRRGNNPYLNPQENKPQQPANALQNNNSKGKTLTAGQMKALSAAAARACNFRLMRQKHSRAGFGSVFL